MQVNKIYDPLSSLFSELLPRLNHLQSQLRQNQLADNLSLQQMIQIGQEIVDTQIAAINGVTMRDIQPDGYNWKKYGEKQEGKDKVKSYFKCSFPKCVAKRFVSFSKETGQMTSTYFNSHTHEGSMLNQQTANSYEEYLLIAARIQQFEFSGEVRNGFNEIYNDKISLDFPGKILLNRFDYEITQQTALKQVQSIITINFSCLQEFEPCRNLQNPLTDQTQQLVYDGFIFVKYGIKKSVHQKTIYQKCGFKNCECTKRIDQNIKLKITKVTFEGRHNHPAFEIFHHEKYLVSLNWIYKLDGQQLINQQKHDDYDYEGQGVLNALTAYVNTEDRQKTDNLIDIYQVGVQDVGSEMEFQQDGDQLKHLFPHIM